MIAFPHKEEIAKAEKYQNVSWEQGLVGVGHSAVTCKASLQHLLTVWELSKHVSLVVHVMVQN